MEKLYTQQKQDQELAVAQIMNSLLPFHVVAPLQPSHSLRFLHKGCGFAIWSLAPLSFLNPACTSGSSQFKYY